MKPTQIKDTKCVHDFYPDELSLIFADKKKKNQMYSFFFRMTLANRISIEPSFPPVNTTSQIRNPVYSLDQHSESVTHSVVSASL